MRLPALPLVLLGLAAAAGGQNLSALEEDARLSCPELITKYGYPVETHEVITEDGYILTLFRIPYGRTSTTKTPNSRPVFLQHGLVSSADNWILKGPDRAFGYILADAGYDVWLGNARGNKWSRRHTTLNPDTPKFWDFSWHEMGVYDLPAVIDHILAETGAEQLYYVGHSMGGTMFFVMGSERPEYNAKIRGSFHFGPGVFMGNIKTPLFKELANFGDGLGELSARMGLNEFLPASNVYGNLSSRFCNDQASTQAMCENFAFLLFGFDPEEYNKTMLLLLLSHDPSGSSTKTVMHYGQIVKTGEFKKFSYGATQNLLRYGSSEAPSYDLSKVTSPVSIHYGENDWMTVPQDVQKLEKALPNLIGKFRVPHAKFNHLDFLTATHSKELVYDYVIQLMDGL